MTFSADAEARLIEAVRRVARDEILPRFRALDPSEVETKSRIDDLVTIADRRSEDRLREAVSIILPQAAFVGEEAVSADPAALEPIATSDLAVIVDPIDGTWNFANGIGLFGVIVAVAERGQTIWGMIYDPLTDDWAIARRGRGAGFAGPGGHLRSCRFDIVPLGLGDIAGMTSSYLFKGRARRELFDRLPEFRRVDSMRCSAHEYRGIVQGQTDFIMTPTLNPWDHAAGCLLVEEAGGVARLLDGTPYTPVLKSGVLLVARSEAIWQTVADHLGALAPG